MARKKKQHQEPAQPVSDAQARAEAYNRLRDQENTAYRDELLARERPSAVQKRLEKVLQQEKNVLKQISIIEKVDLHGVAELERLEQRAAQRNRKLHYHFELPQKKRRRKKPGPGKREKTGIMGYLLREWPRISAFGHFHGLLKGHLFAMRHDLSENFLRYWNVELKVVLHFLEEPLNIMAEEGWASLSRLQYNLVVTFRDLYRFFRDNELLLFENHVPRDFFPRLEPFLYTYLRLTARGEYKELLLDGIHSFLEKTRSFKPVLRKITLAAERLLDIRKPGPNLKNCLLALAMVRYRCFLDFADMQAMFPAQPIADDSFQCPKRIMERIRQYVAGLEQELANLREKYAMMEMLHLSAPGAMEEEMLQRLGELHSNRGQSDNAADTSGAGSVRRLLEYDVVSFTERAVQAFLAQGAPVLEGRESLADGQDARSVMQPFHFSSDVERLRGKLEQLENIRLTHTHLTITWDFFRNFRKAGTASAAYTETERAYCMLLVELAAIFYHLALGCAEFLHQVPQEHGSGEDTVRGADDGARRLTALLHTRLPGTGLLGGLSFQQGLTTLMLAATAFAVVLEEPALMLLLRKKDSMETRIGELEKILRRMA